MSFKRWTTEKQIDYLYKRLQNVTYTVQQGGGGGTSYTKVEVDNLLIAQGSVVETLTNKTLTTPVINNPTGITGADITVDNTNFKVLTHTTSQELWEDTDLAILNSRTTGIRFGGVPTLGASTTGINITAGAGQILDNIDPANPVFTEINWTAQVDVQQTTTPGLTWWYFDDNSNVVKQTTVEPTAAESRTRIYVARTSFVGTLITAIGTEGNPIQQEGQGLRDLAKALGTFKVVGVEPAPDGASLKFQVTSGVLFSYYSNWANSFLNPHQPTEPTFNTAATDVFRYALPSGVIAVDETDIDVANYAPAGVITLIPGVSTRVGIHYIWRFPRGNTRVTYGDNWYATTAAATEALSDGKAAASAPASFSANGILLGAIIAEAGETDLNNATFVATGSFGSFSGGVILAAAGSYLEKANNLSDLVNATTARTNLGLGNVDNTSDADKPVSTAQQNAIDAAVPSLTGTFYFEQPIVGLYIPILYAHVAVTLQGINAALDATGNVDVQIFFNNVADPTGETTVGTATTLTGTTFTAVNITTDATIPAGNTVYIKVTEATTAQTVKGNIRYTED